MLNATRDKILPTTVTGSYPRPAWFTEELHGRSFKDALGHAIKAAKTYKAPLRLMVKEFNRFRTIAIDYHDGLRYPHLERIEGKADYLTPIFTPRK